MDLKNIVGIATLQVLSPSNRPRKRNPSKNPVLLKLQKARGLMQIENGHLSKWALDRVKTLEGAC